MSATARERLRDERETELDRLRSDKLLLAATGAALEPGPVVAAVHRAVTAVRSAATVEAEPGGSPALSEAVEAADARLASVADDLASTGDPSAHDGPTVFQAGDPDTPFERAGAVLVAGPAILDGCCLQAVSFFVNEADEGRADLLRQARDTVDTVGDEGDSAIEAAFETASETSAVDAGATAAVDASYRVYADALAGLGLDPKPVC